MTTERETEERVAAMTLTDAPSSTNVEPPLTQQVRWRVALPRMGRGAWG